MKAFELSRAWHIRMSFHAILARALQKQAARTRRDLVARKITDVQFRSIRRDQNEAVEKRIAQIWSMKP